MDRILADDIGKLVLRVTLGLLLLGHGIHKLTGGIDFIEGMLASHGIPGIVAYGVFVGELVAPIFLLIGVFTRIAGIVVVANMLFAFVLVHLGELFTVTPQGGWALELQAFFLATGLAVAFLGSGRFALRAD